MANLLGQNIGTNYKGILNLNTLNGNLSGTLQAVTDGDGNASPLRLSTTEVSILSNSFLGASSATTNVVTLQSTTRNQIKIPSGTTMEFWYSAALEGMRLTSSGNLVIGTTAATARLHVRGDGTNPIARFENSAGTRGYIITADGLSLQPIGTSGAEAIVAGYAAGFQLSGSVLTINAGASELQSNVTATLAASYGGGWRMLHGAYSFTSGNLKTLHLTGGIAAAAGSANYRNAQFEYTINNSGAQTGTATGIFLNATETALNGMGHNLMDLQVGGVSRFRVPSGNNNVVGYGFTSTTDFLAASAGAFYFTGRTIIQSPADGNLRISNSSLNGFNLLQFGGTTNAFPALKRNGAALEVRLADDSGFANIAIKDLLYGSNGESISNSGNSGYTDFRSNQGWQFTSANGVSVYQRHTSTGSVFGGSSINASAILQADSTTKGFLPPRMTTAQRDLIATPAAGLMIYNTSTNRPNFYDGSAWVAL